MKRIGKKLEDETKKEWFHRYYLVNKKEILERNKDWYDNNPIKVKDQYKRSKLRRKVLRLKRVTLYKLALGGKCLRCDYDENLLILETHHKNGRDDENKNKNILQQPEFKEFCKTGRVPKDIELLCPNCHRNIHHPIEEWFQFKELLEQIK